MRWPREIAEINRRERDEVMQCNKNNGNSRTGNIYNKKVKKAASPLDAFLL